jgi:mannose-6-phosphate isomerase-like protein (cupin superfamily)
MKANVFAHEGEGIKCVYNNKNWVVCIKNWKPDNDIEGLHRLEVHHATDEQFILLNGKSILLVADRKEDKFDIEVIEMEQGKIYNVPQETWFYTIAQKDTKVMYVQDADTSEENSEYIELSEAELVEIREKATMIFNK